MNFNTSTTFLTMSKNPALSQKILGDWFRLPERQELFAGLPTLKPPQKEDQPSITTSNNILGPPPYLFVGLTAHT